MKPWLLLGTWADRLKRAVGARVSDERGDSLVEALAALLIAALGAAALATMVMVASSVVAQNEQAQANAFAAESQVSALAGTSESFAPTATITAGAASGTSKVIVYLSDDGTYVRYVEQTGSVSP